MKPEELFPAPKSTGKLIRSWREAFEISQSDMAFACEISQAALSAIESDKKEIGPKVALKLSAYTGIHPSILLFPKGYENESDFIKILERKNKIEKMAL